MLLCCAQTKNNAIASPKTKLESARSKRKVPLIMHYSISTQTNLDDSAGGRSDTRPKVCTLLGDGASDGGTLHLTLGVDNNTCIIIMPWLQQRLCVLHACACLVLRQRYMHHAL
jgi:hypothetical protein